MSRPSGLTRVGRVRGRLLAAFVALTAATALTACSAGPGAQWQPGEPMPEPEAAKLVFSHDDGAVGVSPGQPVSVQVIDGTLETVSLTSNVGEVPGVLSEDQLWWRSLEDLEFGKTYTLAVSSLGEDGEPVEETRTFSTVDVKVGDFWNVFLNTTGDYLGKPLDGGTWGVGQPIVARFDDSVDQKVAEQTLTVTTNPPVEGSWHWMSDREAHWRPQNYWAPGTQVTVEAKILGVSLATPDGRSLHGQENKKAAFTIGQAKVAKINNATKHMLVYFDGQQVKDIPVSLGREQSYLGSNGLWYDWRTPSGIMVVTEKQNPVLMKPDLPKEDPEYYEEKIDLAVRITNSGIYVHSAPWTTPGPGQTWGQGYTNMSHGCINVSSANAQWFYENFGPGDVVEVVGAGNQVGVRDGLGDWNMPWDQWKAGSALAS